MEVILSDGKYGEVALIDDEDWCGVRLYSWHLSGGYVVSCLNPVWQHQHGTTVRLHRFVLRLPNDTRVVDHINRNVLDNRKCNLRITNKTVNGLNTAQQHTWRAYPKGIKIARNGKYEARVSQKHIGTFATLQEAVAARDAYIREQIDATWKC